jgi:hypothetical protein
VISAEEMTHPTEAKAKRKNRIVNSSRGSVSRHTAADSSATAARMI